MEKHACLKFKIKRWRSSYIRFVWLWWCHFSIIILFCILYSTKKKLFTKNNFFLCFMRIQIWSDITSCNNFFFFLKESTYKCITFSSWIRCLCNIFSILSSLSEWKSILFENIIFCGVSHNIFTISFMSYFNTDTFFFCKIKSKKIKIVLQSAVGNTYLNQVTPFNFFFQNTHEFVKGF